MSDFLIYIGMYARLFFVSFSSTVMMFIVTRTIFGESRMICRLYSGDCSFFENNLSRAAMRQRFNISDGDYRPLKLVNYPSLSALRV